METCERCYRPCDPLKLVRLEYSTHIVVLCFVCARDTLQGLLNVATTARAERLAQLQELWAREKKEKQG